MTQRGHKTSGLVVVSSSFIKNKKLIKRNQKVSAINSTLQYVNWCEHALANYDKCTALTLSQPICLEPEMTRKNFKKKNIFFNTLMALFASSTCYSTVSVVEITPSRSDNRSGTTAVWNKVSSPK